MFSFVDTTIYNESGKVNKGHFQKKISQRKNTTDQRMTNQLHIFFHAF